MMFNIFKQYHILTVFSVITIFAMSGCFSQSTKGKSTTQIEFEKTEVNMGNLTQHHPDTATFIFKNTGDTPLVIYSAEASCGCTQPGYPKEPVFLAAELF
jgi:hypothetical protein